MILRMCQKQVVSCKRLCITWEMINTQVKKIPNSKALGGDGVQGFWLKIFDFLHSRITNQLNDILNGVASLPEWMAYDKTVLCNAVDNYRPISCLLLMWKLLTGVVTESIYLFLEEKRSYLMNRKNVGKEVSELRTNYLLIKLFLETGKKGVPIYLWHG